MTSTAPLALTMGDPSGIGLDLTISAWKMRDKLALPEFLFIGNKDALLSRAKLLNQDIDVIDCQVDDVFKHFNQAIPCLNLPCSKEVITGTPTPDNAQTILASIEKAVELTNSGATSAVVTNPISKAVLYDAGFKHPGHTEFLAELAKMPNGEVPLPVMMLAGPELRTVPVTIHIPLMQVMAHLTTDLIIKTSEITHNDLKYRFGVEHPRLAISGLNPHAGEDGALGHEDAEIIVPAIEALKAKGINVTGPLPADTMFHEDARINYDVALCMYHDQALIPAKALGFHDAVNVTLGLPFIRTSPDHGTAFSIAGKNIARHDSLVAALKMAAKMSEIQHSKGA
jgi:4-hydroxythreonine-4-phosphate dehydrogenase